MKTTIYELLGMIKDNKAPISIYYKGNMYMYDDTSNDYWYNELDSGTSFLFDEYDLISILNDELEILETTITYKPDKIKKLENVEDFKFARLIDKINEIIDRVNNYEWRFIYNYINFFIYINYNMYYFNNI